MLVLQVNTTAAVSTTVGSTPAASSASSSAASSDWADAVDSLDLALVRRAGAFLDGCKVFTSGFSEAQVRLRKSPPILVYLVFTEFCSVWKLLQPDAYLLL